MAARSSNPAVPREQLDWVPIDPELLKRVYDDLVARHGAQVLLQTLLTAVEGGGGVVDSILVTNKAGLSRLRARVFVDATATPTSAPGPAPASTKGMTPAISCRPPTASS
ncbi:MAG: FAD-dependent oxidoreductase [Verrucomicrobiota bacterium]